MKQITKVQYIVADIDLPPRFTEYTPLSRFPVSVTQLTAVEMDGLWWPALSGHELSCIGQRP